MPVRMDQPISGSVEVPAFNVSFKYSFMITNSQIIADIVATRTSHVHTLRNLLVAEIRSVVDVIGYLNGMSFEIDMISAKRNDTSEKIIFGIGIPILLKRRGEPRSEIEDNLLIAVAQEPHGQMALADFRHAMRVPEGTGFFCYRAIETMMQSMKLDSSENESAISWPRFRDALHIDLKALAYVKSHADFPRHGKPSSITDEERAKVFEITDEIIKRYLEYLVRGKKPLLKIEFPILTEG